RDLHRVTVLDRPHGSEGLPDRVDAVGPCGEQTLDVVRPSVRGEVEVHVLAPIEEGVTDGTAHEIDLVAGRGESLPQLNGRERRIHQPAHALRDHAPRIRCLAPSTEAEDGSRKTEVGRRKSEVSASFDADPYGPPGSADAHHLPVTVCSHPNRFVWLAR